jgi:hypothetical protein
MPFLRRTRGLLLRLVRRRGLSVTLGLALVVPASLVEFDVIDAPSWLGGLALVAGATGLALVWTGLTGVSPDWVE